ncbi:glycosyltransferase family 4 protein [Pseudomonadota bacterium]
MKKLNLCLAAPSFFPTYGGAQLRFLRYLPGLHARSIDTRIVTGTPTANEHTAAGHAEEWQKSRVGDILDSATPDGTPVHRVRLPDEKGWQRAVLFNQTVARGCLQAGHQAEVLQLVTSLQPLTIPWIRYLRARRIAVAYAVTIAPRQNKISKNRFKRAYRSWSARELYNQLDCIITNNTPLRDIVREMGVTTPVEVIPNGVDLRRFKPSTDGNEHHELRASLGVSGNDFLVTTVGAVIPRKGGDILLEAWLRIAERFPSAHLALIGPRTDLQDPKLAAFRDRLESLRQASPAPQNVHFVGEVAEIETYMRATDVLVLPSDREGMPNSVLEAMASKVPVVLTPFTGLSDDLGTSGQHFLLAERDAHSLAEAILGLLDNSELRAELAAGGHNWVTSRMDMEIALDRYAGVYRELAAQYRK